MKNKLSILFVFVSICAAAQVGIGTSSPNATLDLAVDNANAPEITDGLLISRIADFPLSNPGVDQNSMLVYLNTKVNRNINGTATDYMSGFY